MRLRSLPLGLSLALVVVLAMRMLTVYGALPEVVASHFDGMGRPNGYQSKAGFVTLTLGLSLGMLVVFASIPAWIRRMPPELINLPNRDYWLAPERRQWAITRMGHYLDWFMLATLVVLGGTFELAIRANLAQAPLCNSAMWSLLGGYLVFVLFWSAALLRSFALPSSSSA